MKPISRKVTISLMLILALLAASIVGCPNKDTDTTKTTDAPTIPPEITFIMNFDDFNSEGEAASATIDTGTSFQFAGFTISDDDLYPSGQYAAGSQSNWNWAAWNVGVWSTLILIGSALPIAIFVESFHHTPQLLEGDTWEWYYSVPVGAIVYSAKLHGKFINDYDNTDPGVRWEMYVSKEGHFTDYLLYYGESRLPATEGFWILNINPSDATDLSDPTEVIRIDWAHNLTDDTYSIQYTNIVPDGPENGGYISFEVTTDDPYDRSYDIYNKGQNNLTEIEWSSTTQEGQTKDVHHFGNDDWYCWGSDHQNTNCGA